MVDPVVVISVDGCHFNNRHHFCFGQIISLCYGLCIEEHKLACNMRRYHVPDLKASFRVCRIQNHFVVHLMSDI